MTSRFCRSCGGTQNEEILDLGFAPPSNSLLSQTELNAPEITYPLRVFLCLECWLLQTQDFVNEKELFSPNYHYFSSVSSSWLKHCEDYVSNIVPFLGLTKRSLVYEIASNDGYLLQFFSKLKIPSIGVEPTESTALVSREKGIETVSEFFDKTLATRLAEKYGKADLIICNNVYAHVPDINSFTFGLSLLLSDNGVCTLEFPHVLNLLKYNEFDTIYHEHFSYLSLIAVKSIIEKYGLKIIRVEEISTHGGSLRVFLAKTDSEWKVENSVSVILEKEVSFGLNSIVPYKQLSINAHLIKRELLNFLLIEQNAGRKVAAIGAAAKGNTLLNFARVGADLLSYVIDSNPMKQGKFLPGSHIPVFPPKYLVLEPPQSILILPWNIADELVRDFKGYFPDSINLYTAIPSLRKI